jgi:hypothetical protein
VILSTSPSKHRLPSSLHPPPLPPKSSNQLAPNPSRAHLHARAVVRRLQAHGVLAGVALGGLLVGCVLRLHLLAVEKRNFKLRGICGVFEGRRGLAVKITPLPSSLEPPRTPSNHPFRTCSRLAPGVCGGNGARGGGEAGGTG